MSGTTDPGAPRDLRARLKTALSARYAPWSIIVLAMVLTAPSMLSGLSVDDFLHAIVLAKIPLAHAMRGPLDLFRFADGNPATARTMMDVGLYPWTSDPTARFAFFRPLSAATHVLDYALWPKSPALMHVQNIVWYAIALIGVGAGYRRLLQPRWVAGLALLLYAVDDTHGMAVGWIANRNAVVALALSAPVLLLHDSWRRRGDKRAGWLAVPLFGVALLAGESAVATLAYLVAYELHLATGSWGRRAASLVPYSVVLVVWRVIYQRLGYGVAGSGLYLDPGQRPLEFLAAVPHRLPILLLGQFGIPRSDFGETYSYMSPVAVKTMLVFALAFLTLFALAAAPVVTRDPVARFFATGLVLAAIPICAAFLSDRLLMFVGVGAMGLVAQLIASATERLQRLVVLFVALVHLVVSPILLPVRARIVDYQAAVDAADATIPMTPDVASKTLVLINPPNDLFDVYVPAVRAVRGEPRPFRIRGLANVLSEVDVTRVDDRTLRVRPRDGFLNHGAEKMLRDAHHPMLTGTVVEMTGMTVTVTATTPDLRPAEVLFHFDLPLEDPSFLWMCWTREGYASWTPPPLGVTAHLPAHDFRQFMLDMEDRLSAL